MRNVAEDANKNTKTYPLKIRHIENNSCAMFDPVSACSIPAIMIEVNVDVNIRKIRINRNIVPPRIITESVAYAFRNKPIG